MQEKDPGSYKFQLSIKLGPLSPKGEPLQMLNVRANDFSELTEALRLVTSNAPEILAAASAFRPVGPPAAVPVQTPLPATPAAGPAPAPLPQEGSEIGPLTLERLNVNQGTGKTGKPFTRYQAVFSGGIKASTFDTLIAGAAQGLVGKPVFARVTKGNYGYDLDSIRAA